MDLKKWVYKSSSMSNRLLTNSFTSLLWGVNNKRLTTCNFFFLYTNRSFRRIKVFSNETHSVKLTTPWGVWVVLVDKTRLSGSWFPLSRWKCRNTPKCWGPGSPSGTSGRCKCRKSWLSTNHSNWCTRFDSWIP